MRLIDADALKKRISDHIAAITRACGKTELTKAVIYTLGTVYKTIDDMETVDALPKVEMNVFDKEEVFENCTVQVLTNSVTGETSIGWWENENPVD